LRNGDSIYTFSFPKKLISADQITVQNKIENNLNTHQYDAIPVKEHTAQVHRSHPGELYTTLHEGNENPTITLKHHNEDKWKLIKKSDILDTAKEQGFNFAKGYAERSAPALIGTSALTTY
jgi:hypothetical protein